MNISTEDEKTWLFYRQVSLQPGGFGEDRVRIWPALLGAQPFSDPPPYSEVDGTNDSDNPMEERTDEPEGQPHVDERQIKLDTDRSFVLYPDSGPALARDALQNDLHALLVAVFRKRRSLHYFQGFHDIVTVVFLTLPRPLHLACTEKMSLHRVRDAMGVGLEPVLGLLRVLRNLLRLVDPAYAKLLESTSPLPYHALSHLLTLFSHDVPTLPLIQHVWDFLLSREPIALVWLVAAFVLHRKPSVYLLAEQDEEGMIHSLLSGMPELVDAESECYVAKDDDDSMTRVDHAADDGTVSGESIGRSCSDDGESDEELDRLLEKLRDGDRVQKPGPRRTRARDRTKPDQTNDQSDMTQGSDGLRADCPSPSTKTVQLPEETDQSCADEPCSPTAEFAASIPLPDSRPASPDPLSELTSSESRMPEEESSQHIPSSPTSSHVLQHMGPSPGDPVQSSPAQSNKTTNGPTSHINRPPPRKLRTKAPPVSLTYLLRQADDLLAAYPPSHPSLHLTEILGPDSAMRTWRPPQISSTRDTVPEKQPYHDTDDYLETLVSSPYIVIPSPPPSPLLGRLSTKKTKLSPKALSKTLLNPRGISLRLGALTPAERRVLFIGALFIVGAAMALKSGRVPCMDGLVKADGGDGLKRLWNSKRTLIPSVFAAWGRGLP